MSDFRVAICDDDRRFRCIQWSPTEWECGACVRRHVDASGPGGDRKLAKMFGPKAKRCPDCGARIEATEFPRTNAGLVPGKPRRRRKGELAS